MFTTRHGLRSLWPDLGLLISQLRQSIQGKVPRWGEQRPNALESAKLESGNPQASYSRIGASLRVKGEISGSEDLLVMAQWKESSTLVVGN